MNYRLSLLVLVAMNAGAMEQNQQQQPAPIMAQPYKAYGKLVSHKVLEVMRLMQNVLEKQMNRDVVAQIMMDIIKNGKGENGQDYSVAERLNIAMEMIADPYYEEYKPMFVKLMYATPDLSLRRDTSKKFQLSPVQFARKQEYDSSVINPLMPWELFNSLYDTAMVKYLLSSGANPNVQNDKGETPLIFALKYHIPNLLEVAKLLISYGANPNIADQTGRNAFDYMKPLEQKKELQKLFYFK